MSVTLGLLVPGLEVETIVESAVERASKGLISELFSDLSFGLQVILELELFPFTEGGIDDYSHFAQVGWVDQVAGVSVSLCFEAIVEGKLDFLAHFKGLLQ